MVEIKQNLLILEYKTGNEDSKNNLLMLRIVFQIVTLVRGLL